MMSGPDEMDRWMDVCMYVLAVVNPLRHVIRSTETKYGG